MFANVKRFLPHRSFKWRIRIGGKSTGACSESGSIDPGTCKGWRLSPPGVIHQVTSSRRKAIGTAFDPKRSGRSFVKTLRRFSHSSSHCRMLFDLTDSVRKAVWWWTLKKCPIAWTPVSQRLIKTGRSQIFLKIILESKNRSKEIKSNNNNFFFLNRNII